MPLSTVNNQRLSDLAYYKLRHAIMEGTLPSGSRLVELELARVLKFGRTPVHDALIRLTGDQLVESVPNAGFLVRAFTLEDLDTANDIRCVMECLAVRLACRRGFPDSRLLDMEEECEAMAKAMIEKQPRDVARADFRFHQAIIRLPNDRQVESAVRASHLQFFTWSRTLPQQTYLECSIDVAAEHRAILELLRKRDADGAETSLRKHLGDSQLKLGRIRRAPMAGHAPESVRIFGELGDGLNSPDTPTL